MEEEYSRDRTSMSCEETRGKKKKKSLSTDLGRISRNPQLRRFHLLGSVTVVIDCVRSRERDAERLGRDWGEIGGRLEIEKEDETLIRKTHAAALSSIISAKEERKKKEKKKGKSVVSLIFFSFSKKILP